MKMPQATKMPATRSDRFKVWYGFLSLANLYLPLRSVQKDRPPAKANASRHSGILSFILSVA